MDGSDSLVLNMESFGLGQSIVNIYSDFLVLQSSPIRKDQQKFHLRTAHMERIGHRSNFKMINYCQGTYCGYLRYLIILLLISAPFILLPVYLSFSPLYSFIQGIRYLFHIYSSPRCLRMLSMLTPFLLLCYAPSPRCYLLLLLLSLIPDGYYIIFWSCYM
jgi:hypothetical protein